MWENKSQTRPPVTTKSGNGEKKTFELAHLSMVIVLSSKMFVHLFFCYTHWDLTHMLVIVKVPGSLAPKMANTAMAASCETGAIRVRHGTTTHPVPRARGTRKSAFTRQRPKELECWVWYVVMISFGCLGFAECYYATMMTWEICACPLKMHPCPP